MKNYKYPHIQWFAEAMGIVMITADIIIITIISIMIQDVSLLQVITIYTKLKRKNLERAAVLNANSTVLSLALP